MPVEAGSQSLKQSWEGFNVMAVWFPTLRCNNQSEDAQRSAPTMYKMSSPVSKAVSVSLKIVSPLTRMPVILVSFGVLPGSIISRLRQRIM